MRKFFYGSCLYMLMALVSSCVEGSSIGGSIQPTQDVLYTDTATFRLTSRTIRVDSILQRNAQAILGEYTDAVFGTTHADFMSQLYCPPNFTFQFDSIVNDQIDSAFLYLFFDEWYGDSASLFEVSVYQLNAPINLDQPSYTNIQIDRYCDRSILLGKSSYTVENSENRWSDAYDYCIRVPLDTAFAQKIYRDNKNPEMAHYFDGPRNFAEYFNGFYITTSFGNGSLVYVSNVQLELCYDYRYLDAETNSYKDTIASSNFITTKEVKQINTYEHPDLSGYISINDSDSLNYLYSPAGMFTRVEIPMDSLCRRLAGKNVNHARLKVSATELNDDQWGMNPPEKLLLIREQDVHTFFSQYNLADDEYSFLAEYNESDECFVFDMGASVQKAIRYADGDLDSTSTYKPFSKMLIVPVDEIVNSDKASLYLLPETKPSAVKIRSGSHPSLPMKMELIYSNKK